MSSSSPFESILSNNNYYYINYNNNNIKTMLHSKIINILYTMNYMFENKICICKEWCCQDKCVNITFNNIAYL